MAFAFSETVYLHWKQNGFIPQLDEALFGNNLSELYPYKLFSVVREQWTWHKNSSEQQGPPLKTTVTMYIFLATWKLIWDLIALPMGKINTL